MSPPSWSAILRPTLDATAAPQLVQLNVLLQQQLKDQSNINLSSKRVFNDLNIGQLNDLLRGLELEGQEARNVLTALNSTLRELPPVLSVALVQHGTIEALLLGIYKRTGLAHPLTPLVVEALNTLCMSYEAVMGHTDALSEKQELLELAVTTIIWMANDPDHMHSTAGLVMAQQTVNICWSLCRHDTPASRAASSLFNSAELGPRSLQLAAALASEAYRQGMPDPAGYAWVPCGGSEGPQRVSIGELVVSVMTMSSGFAISRLGLVPSLDTSSAGLHRMRSLMLRPSLMADACSVLSSLVDELQGTGRCLAHSARPQQQQQQQQQAVLPGSGQQTSSAVGGGAEGAALLAEDLASVQRLNTLGLGASSSSGTTAPQAGSSAVEAGTEAEANSPAAAKHQDPSSKGKDVEGISPSTSAPEASGAVHIAVEGAVRNLLTFLGVPLLCCDYAKEAEVEALTSFSLQYCYMMFQEGFIPIFKRLADRNAAYGGPFLPFFCAMSDLLQECSTIIGQQFSAWGVELSKHPNPSSDPQLLVPQASGGADAASAHAFITQQVGNCMGWSQRALKLMMLSKSVDASISGKQQKVGQGPARSAVGKAKGQVCCFCGNAASGAVLKSCPCGLASYCGKICQTAAFPQHREECKRARKQLAASQKP